LRIDDGGPETTSKDGSEKGLKKPTAPKSRHCHYLSSCRYGRVVSRAGKLACVLSGAELSNMVFSYLSIQGVDFRNLLF
jgi:hypothetical protein